MWRDSDRFAASPNSYLFEIPILSWPLQARELGGLFMYSVFLFARSRTTRRPFTASRLFVGLLLALAGVASLSAQCRLEESDKHLPADGFNGAVFGERVALDGDVAVIGAPSDREIALNSGAAYVYRRVGESWVEEQKLTPIGASASDFFGSSVAVFDDLIVVGSLEHSDLGIATGAAYVFRHNGATWVEEQRLALVDGESLDLFGVAVDVYGDALVVGADSRDVALEDEAGSAYVYRFSGVAWEMEAVLTAGIPSEDAFFGGAVALDGSNGTERLIVGAHSENEADPDAGAAYVFVHLGGGAWVQEQRILSTDISEDDLFGFAVDIEGSLAVVSAIEHDPLGDARGAAYVFRQVAGSWAQEAKLVASDAEPFDRYGRDIALSGDLVLTSAGDDDFGNVSGAGYLYRFTGTGWVEQAKLVGTDLGTNVKLGDGLDLDGTAALLGAPGANDNGAASGALYSFDLPSLALNLSAETVTAGDTLVADGCGAVPGQQIALVAVEFAGNPIQRFFEVGTVGVDGSWSAMLDIPANPVLPGNSSLFELWTFDRFDSVVSSNRTEVSFE